MVTILLGPPGVGKGTQGVQLCEELGWRHLSTGDLLREHRRKGTELGREAQRYMDAGELVPDDVILDMVRNELASTEKRSVVFDGFPRTVPQAEGLDRVLADLGERVDGVVVLEADPEVLVKRLAGRRSCPECGAVYNVHFNPPTEEGVCDRCGHALVHRSDDQPDTVRNRLRVYEKQTAPLIDYYEGSGARVIRVNGDQPVEAVQADIRDAVGTETGTAS